MRRGRSLTYAPGMDDASRFCRQHALDGGASLIASASTGIDAWLLIEYPDAWGAKAVEMAAFSPNVRQRLDGWTASLPRMRPQLIRRPSRAPGPLQAYLAITNGPRPTVLRFELADEQQWLDLDIPAALELLSQGQMPPFGERSTLPLVLVCTHGKRDACCAKWGLPVYEAASSHADFDVWQSSHLGGHRFAATLTVLPLGLSYGRVSPEDVPSVLAASANARVWDLDHFRGRHMLSSVGMAAEHYVREHTGDLETQDIEVVDLEPATACTQAVRVRFGATYYRVQLRPVQTAIELPPSCGKAPETTTELTLVSIATASPPAHT